MSSYFKNTLNSYKSLTSSNNTETLLRDVQEYINIVSSPYCVPGGGGGSVYSKNICSVDVLDGI